MPAARRRKAGKAGLLAVPAAAEERGKGQFQTMQHCIFTLAIDRAQAAIDPLRRAAQRGDLRILLFRLHTDAAQPIGVTPPCIKTALILAADSLPILFAAEERIQCG